jgi:hypothetical protein
MTSRLVALFAKRPGAEGPAVGCQQVVLLFARLICINDGCSLLPIVSPPKGN